jgi:hypothetical protein
MVALQDLVVSSRFCPNTNNTNVIDVPIGKIHLSTIYRPRKSRKYNLHVDDINPIYSDNMTAP